MSNIEDQKEINRLNAEVEALRGEVDLIKTLGVGAALETVAQKKRAQKAEAENARLTEERDSAQRVGIQTMRERDEARAERDDVKQRQFPERIEKITKSLLQRAEAADAEVAMLKEALTDAIKWMDGSVVSGGYPAWYSKARKTLEAKS